MEEQSICPVSYAKGLDNAIRRTIQNPHRIISPYVKKGMTVLDMGCGPGFFTIPMAEILKGNGRVIAADIQQGMLDIVKKKTESAGLQSTVQLHLCGPAGIQLNEQADFVLAFYVIHEIPDARSLFHELHSIMKPGATMLIKEPAFHVKKQAFEKMISIIKEEGFEIQKMRKGMVNMTVVISRQ